MESRIKRAACVIIGHLADRGVIDPKRANDLRAQVDVATFLSQVGALCADLDRLSGNPDDPSVTRAHAETGAIALAQLIGLI